MKIEVAYTHYFDDYKGFCREWHTVVNTKGHTFVYLNLPAKPTRRQLRNWKRIARKYERTCS